MTANEKKFVMPEAYLANERQATERSEYFAGEILPLSGASRARNIIRFNIAGALQTQLRDKPCEGYAGDMRVYVPSAGFYTYPDIVVVRGEPQFLDEQADTLLNPALIIEILSPREDSYHHYDKFRRYRSILTLFEYVAFAQDERRAEHYFKQPTGSWLLTDITAPHSEIALRSIECVLTFADVYDKVKF
jgi:Uma2 family endonuclease